MTTINIKHIHIEAPRGTKPKGMTQLSNEMQGLRSDNVRYRAEIERLVSLNQTLRDIPVNTVTQEYHTQQVKAQGEAHRKEIQRFMDSNNKMKGKWEAAFAANSQAAGREDELANSLKVERKRKRELIADHAEAENKWSFEMSTANTKIGNLEDKIAGYELGMSKEQVKKECGEVDKPKKKAGMTNEEVWAVRRYIASGRKNVWIEKHTGLDDAVVSRLKMGHSYLSVGPEPKNAPRILPTRWQHKETTAHAGHGIVKQEKKHAN